MKCSRWRSAGGSAAVQSTTCRLLLLVISAACSSLIVSFNVLLLLSVAESAEGVISTPRFIPNVYHPSNLSFVEISHPELESSTDRDYQPDRRQDVKQNDDHILTGRSFVRKQYGACSSGPSLAEDGECMLVLYCVVAGGQAGGRCGSSIFYTCCYKPVTTRSSPSFDLSSVLGSANALPKKLQRRIIGGDDAHFGEFPWQAHIKIGRQQCGGALVSHHYVITAAHCVHLNPLRRISVVLGAYDIQASRYSRSSSARTFRVAQKKIHPNFAFSASQPDRFDVALLKLDRYIHYQENILPVCLPPRGWTFEGWRATVTGWGKTDASLNNRYGTRVLQKVQVPIITRLECERWHQLRGIHIKIYPEMMCAGYKEGKRDACVGDSGGPMTLFLNGRWTIVGITSAGFGCAQSHQPGIYHQVSVSVDWVLANL
ncbi:brain-specific serine protease 4-like [Varroa jacobsoni]|uniref:brain-specific serine protease 4-like n=1 Tax=Varroa jacobsoni TaxID=62625 RepID=UPI000BF2E5C7|nr:brain-specific serine protease 4-like [Varroa jacobsoni]